jgi:2-keto-4-pentenoate hydratase/2-oxohepta-3-ene-1,7-dioic acid hydratase in catechol pathway
VKSLDLLSPVTVPCRVVAQMTNFASHVEDTGGNPKKVPLTFFRKASGSLAGPVDDIVKPDHVRLLDYEVEIGLVIGRDMPVGTTITADNFPDYVCGVAVTNDVSARGRSADENAVLRIQVVPDFHTSRAGAGAAGRRRARSLSVSCACTAGQRRTSTGQHGRKRHDLSA